MQIPGNPLMLPYTISQTLPTNRLLKWPHKNLSKAPNKNDSLRGWGVVALLLWNDSYYIG